MFKTRNSYQEKPEMAIEKRKKTSYNGTKETNKEVVKVTIRKKQNKLDQRTKIIMIIVLIFVVILAFSYINLRQKSKKIAKEQQQVESQIKKQEEKKKELKKKKEYIKTKEFIEKTATEKFGLLYPGEYLLKGSDD